MKNAYNQGLECDHGDEEGREDAVSPKDVGHNMYILAHQVPVLFCLPSVHLCYSLLTFLQGLGLCSPDSTSAIATLLRFKDSTKPSRMPASVKCWSPGRQNSGWERCFVQLAQGFACGKPSSDPQHCIVLEHCLKWSPEPGVAPGHCQVYPFSSPKRKA